MADENPEQVTQEEVTPEVDTTETPAAPENGEPAQEGGETVPNEETPEAEVKEEAAKEESATTEEVKPTTPPTEGDGGEQQEAAEAPVAAVANETGEEGAAAPTGEDGEQPKEGTEEATKEGESPKPETAGETNEAGDGKPSRPQSQGVDVDASSPLEETLGDAREESGVESATLSAGDEGEAPAEGGDAEAAKEAAAEGGDEDAKPAGEGDEEQSPGDEAQKPEGEDEATPDDGEQAPAMEGIPEGDEEAAKSPVPQSDTFAEGEKPETPLAIGEKLSREASPTGDNLMTDRTMSPPVPGTPDRVSEHGSQEDDEEEEEEEDYDDDEPQFDRDQLIERYHQALSERQQLQEQNYQLQHKLAEYFRRKKADERQDMDKNVTDQEQRYLKYMANLDELRRQDTEERESFKLQIEEMRDRCEDRQKRVEDEQLKFKEFKKEIAHGSLNSRSGKPIPAKDVEQHFINESRKEEEVVKVRLENIKLKNKLKKKEAQLKSKEELAEGLHMIDFEQLKIENQTYNEKIEERNEELLKLRKKITSTVQVLTHLKEKLQFVQGENGTLKSTLKEVEELAAKKRDVLSRTKQARDGLRIDNQRLRQNCGLLGNEPLLRDFEERKDESDDLKQKLDELKMQHAELTLNLNGVRRKIQQAQVGRQ